jgi:hypothetical protein
MRDSCASFTTDGFQRESAVHGAALEVHVAELAGETRGDGALARARRAVDSNDQFAWGVVVHSASRRLYTEAETVT